MPLRDLLMNLAENGLFLPRWSDMIHEEWMRNVSKNTAGATAEKLELVRSRMDDKFRDGRVIGYEHRMHEIKLPDQDDLHVLAAAIHANAGEIVTFNLKDFPTEELEGWKIKAKHPDDFIAGLLDLHPKRVIEAMAAHRRSLNRPPLTADEYLDMLARQGLGETVGKLREREAAL